TRRWWPCPSCCSTSSASCWRAWPDAPCAPGRRAPAGPGDPAPPGRRRAGTGAGAGGTPEGGSRVRDPDRSTAAGPPWRPFGRDFPLEAIPTRARVFLCLCVHAEGSGEVSPPLEAGPRQHVADVEEAVALLRALWSRAAAAADRGR